MVLSMLRFLSLFFFHQKKDEEFAEKLRKCQDEQKMELRRRDDKHLQAMKTARQASDLNLRKCRSEKSSVQMVSTFFEKLTKKKLGG